ncbi:MAG: hypothetical protein ACAI34_15250, partial [Verrucomicrobium sp.]
MKTLLTLTAMAGLWSAMPSGVPPQELEHAFDSAIGSMAGVFPAMPAGVVEGTLPQKLRDEEGER